MIPLSHFKFVIKFILIFTFSSVASGQKNQKIGVVTMEYILSKIPSYNQAQIKLENQVKIWKQNLDDLYLKLDLMKREFLHEKLLLTDSLIQVRTLEIESYANKISEFENTHFGSEGKLFKLRKKLVTPYQDLVFNTIKMIAEFNEYGLIFEKSSSATLLYNHNSYDISDLVLKHLKKSIQSLNSKNEKD